ncbi:Fe-Mn family superoxide dismutase [Erysipelotrichaceae bacterium]|nr:Fe-Mn family superoxide dismutase [Erysipelotrichaceae bacterium]
MFKLPELGYAYDALEPNIDAKTMEIHYSKHHNAYITNLNAALEKYPDLQGKTIDALLADIENIPADIKGAVRNNGGGHFNHSLFWTLLAPVGTSKISAVLETAITTAFGSVDAFKVEFETAAKTRFGSGWAWLVLNNNKLEVMSTPNQDAPIMEGKVALLGLDVWEHAYYLKYQNLRPDYCAAFWDVVNWEAVEKNYQKAL